MSSRSSRRSIISATTSCCRARQSSFTMGEERQADGDAARSAIVHGVVKNITEYGAFVDLGGIDGLLHITDMSWRRDRHPSEVVQVGQEVEPPRCSSSTPRRTASAQSSSSATIRGSDRAAVTRTARSCSARSPTSPTTARSSRSSPASRAWCTSRRWTGRTRTSPRQDRQLRDEVEVMVLEIDEDNRRISLGMKQCKPEPVEEFSDTQRGRQGPRQSVSITDRRRAAWRPASTGWSTCRTCRGASPREAVRDFKKGDEVEAIVPRDRRRASAFARRQATRWATRSPTTRARPRDDGDRQGHPSGRARGRRSSTRRDRLPACVGDLPATVSRMPATSWKEGQQYRV